MISWMSPWKDQMPEEGSVIVFCSRSCWSMSVFILSSMIPLFLLCLFSLLFFTRSLVRLRRYWYSRSSPRQLNLRSFTYSTGSMCCCLKDYSFLLSLISYSDFCCCSYIYMYILHLSIYTRLDTSLFLILMISINSSQPRGNVDQLTA